MEKEELIKRIESNKHDIVMRVRSVVKDPITFLNRKGAADPAYFNFIIRKRETGASFFVGKKRTDTSS